MYGLRDAGASFDRKVLDVMNFRVTGQIQHLCRIREGDEYVDHVQRGGADPSAQSDEGTSKLNHQISTCSKTFRVGFVALQDLNALFSAYPKSILVSSSPE